MVKNRLKIKGANFKMKIAIIMLCTLGTSGSYAMFTSHKEYKPDIKLELGNLNTKLIGNENDIPLNIEGIMPGEIRNDSFIFKNTGTLKQNLQINFNINVQEREILKYFNYEFKIKDVFSEKSSKIYSGNMFDLNSDEYIHILNESSEKMVIDQNEEVEFLFTIELSKDIPQEYSDENFKFNLKMLSTQVNQK